MTTRDDVTEPDVSPVLRCTSLDVGYHRRPVVRNLSLDVRPGEILTILGANGAGRRPACWPWPGCCARSPGR